MGTTDIAAHREPWNKGKIVGQKAPFKLEDNWALRVRLQMENRVRQLALFNLGIDSKLRGCDLVALKVRDVCHGDQLASRAVVMQHKTQRPVQFEITPAARDAVQKCDSGVLTCPQVWRVVNATREQEIVRLQPCRLDPLLYGVTGGRRDLELNGSLGLVLHHDGPRGELVAVADVANVERHEREGDGEQRWFAAVRAVGQGSRSAQLVSGS